jgi:hypothetical protein
MLMKKDEISFYGMMIILELIPTSRNYLESYIEKFPENQSDAISYSTDTACDCKQTLIDHYNNNTQEVNEFNSNFVEKFPTEIDWIAFIKRHEVVNVAGTFVEIDKTPEAYYELTERMSRERWAFRHMSVTTDTEKYVVFFA